MKEAAAGTVDTRKLFIHTRRKQGTEEVIPQRLSLLLPLFRKQIGKWQRYTMPQHKHS